MRQDLPDGLNDGDRLASSGAGVDVRITFVQSKVITHGPKTMKGGDPGGSDAIETTACSCGAFLAIKLL